MRLTAAAADLESRVEKLKLRYQGLGVGLGEERWMDYLPGGRTVPPGVYVTTGWVFGDAHRDVALFCRQIELRRPSDSEVTLKVIENRVTQLLVSDAGVSANSDLEKEVYELEQLFAGLTLTLDRWDKFVDYQQPVGDAPHRVPSRDPNILTGI